MAKLKTHLGAMLALGATASLMAGGESSLFTKETHLPTRCKNTSEIPGYAHSGMYSQSKKLRKGAGSKKLTRAQRKKMAQYRAIH